MSQSLCPDALTTTCEPGAAVTVLLAFPSADRTVTDMPPAPVVLALTLPPPAVTLVDMPPALDVAEVLLPEVLELLCTAHPPDEDELLELDALWANAGLARRTADAMPIAAFNMESPLVGRPQIERALGVDVPPGEAVPATTEVCKHGEDDAAKRASSFVLASEPAEFRPPRGFYQEHTRGVSR